MKFDQVLKMKHLLLISLFFYVALAGPDDEKKNKFNQFKNKFGKKYKNKAEEDARYSNYVKNLDYVTSHNSLFAQGKKSYRLAENAFSDMTIAEVLKTRAGASLKWKRSTKSTTKKTTRTTTLKTTKTSTTTTKTTTTTTTTTTTATTSKSSSDVVDWRLNNIVTPVKDQGSCGSCWSFASTGAIEAQLNIKSLTNPNLSDQNLVDCSRSFGNYGCNGGWMTNAFDYIISNQGINDGATYPYEAVDGSCRYKNSNVAATLSGYVEIPYGNEAALENAVRNVGPVAVAVDASNDFAYYSSGVLPSTACTTSINHAVLVVGFNNTNSPPYWIVKNSWGTWWGDQGYIKIEKNKNSCAIANYGTYPTV